jgi:TetR/AcrR family transcriptional regulator
MSTRSHTAEIRRGSRHQPEARRNAILQAALVEFAREGLAGARMDAIADAAGVNKALLYYYFGDKETLYGSILDRFFERLADRIMAVCNQPGSAGERFLAYVRTHYDAIAESPYYAHIFMGELMSASRDGSPHLDRIFVRYMRPIGWRVLELVEEGVKRREFRAVDPNQFVPSAIGSIVHYFLTAPLRQKFMPAMDFTSAKAIKQRRAAVLDFVAAALFADREKGLELAAKIAAQPVAKLGSDTVAKHKRRERRSAAVPPSTPASIAAGSPSTPATIEEPPLTRGIELDIGDPTPPGGYRWMNRWFPDIETAARVLAEERERHPRSKRKRPTGEEEGPK